MSQASAAKSRGDAAYKEKRWEDAVTEYSQAIDLADPDQDADMHKFYSNRAAVFMRLHKFREAAQDAEACTHVKPSFAKGYSRLGYARQALGEHTKAIHAFKKAVELDDSAEYKTALATAQQTETRTVAAGRLSVLAFAQLTVRMCAMAHAVVFATAITAGRAFITTQYRAVLVFSAISLTISLSQRHGLPKFSSDYAAKVFSDLQAHKLLSVMVLFLSISVTGVLGLLLPELPETASGLFRILERLLGPEPTGRWRRFLVGRGIMRSNGTTGPVMWRHAAAMEVATGITLLLSLPTPGRSIIMLVIYWQTLQMRVVLEKACRLAPADGTITLAFSQLDEQITSFISRAPTFVQSGYQILKNLLVRQVQLPEPGKKPSMCTVS